MAPSCLRSARANRWEITALWWISISAASPAGVQPGTPGNRRVSPRLNARLKSRQCNMHHLVLIRHTWSEGPPEKRRVTQSKRQNSRSGRNAAVLSLNRQQLVAGRLTVTHHNDNRFLCVCRRASEQTVEGLPQSQKKEKHPQNKNNPSVCAEQLTGHLTCAEATDEPVCEATAGRLSLCPAAAASAPPKKERGESRGS